METEKNGESPERLVSPMWYWIIGACALVSLIGLALLEPFTAPPASGQEVEVSGRVFRSDGTPVKSFEIIISSGTQSTCRRLPFLDPQGRYTFTLKPGTYRILCVAEGVGSAEEKLTVQPASERVWLSFTLGD